MKPSCHLSSRRRVAIARFVGATVVWVICMTIFQTVAVHGAGVVVSCTEANLRAAAAGGGTVTFACDGTITLATTLTNSLNTVLDASGHQVVISGGSFVRIFYVATNVTLFVTNLTFVNGNATNGGGIFNDGGIVILENCVFSNNTALGPAGTDLSQFSADAGAAYGAAVFNTGFLHARNCLFSQNFTSGGRGGDNSLMIPWPIMAPVPGGAGGKACGAAIYNTGQAAIECSLFVSNSAVGGLGGGGKGGWVSGDMLWDGGEGGIGGDANGGAIFNGGKISLINCTLTMNSGKGGGGGNGGFASGYWHYNVWYHGKGGKGGLGGNGFGGIWSSNALCLVTNCTVADNFASGGTNGTSSPYWCGIGSGGCGDPWFPPQLVAGGIGQSGVLLVNSILAFNAPFNYYGSLTDAGNNLSSDTSAAFTNAGSRTNLNPFLGPLANHGGYTWTMPLLPGSPAIDAGAGVAAPATDQRGVARPQGPGSDIGAYEFQYIPFFSDIFIAYRTNCQLQLAGVLPNQSFILQASSNLTDWNTITNAVFGTNGVFNFSEPVYTNNCARFYRFYTP